LHGGRVEEFAKRKTDRAVAELEGRPLSLEAHKIRGRFLDAAAGAANELIQTASVKATIVPSPILLSDRLRITILRPISVLANVGDGGLAVIESVYSDPTPGPDIRLGKCLNFGPPDRVIQQQHVGVFKRRRHCLSYFMQRGAGYHFFKGSHFRTLAANGEAG
jgi:hypothetical protein